jgi:uncharacterized protein (DUF1800 family)
MDRRDFLIARRRSAREALQASHPPVRTLSGLTPYAGTFGQEEIIHLLKRTMFGASLGDLAHFTGMTMSQAVDELLNPTAAMPAPPVKEYSSSTDAAVAAGTTWVNDRTTDGTLLSQRRASFKKWAVGVLLNQDRSIREKMTLFWHNHFSTETATVQDAQLIYRHHSLLRTNALGNFKSLVRAVTVDPGMLVYLNGYLNTKTAPDENYGRELQELFTIGKENNPNYTEDDVKTAARVLTGWRINATTGLTYFDPTRHDTGNKTFSSFYNNTVITGDSSAAGGDNELDALLAMIFSKQVEVSQFIVKKIYRWFCYYTIDSVTQANVIDPLAQVFRDNNWDILPVLATLLKSDHFFDPLNRGCLIKSPLELSVQLCREFGVAFPDPVAAYSDAYNMWDFIYYQASIANQSLGDPPNVSGWPSYYQAPQYYELWINSDTLPKRFRFSDLLISSGYTRGSYTLKIDPVGFARQLSNPGDPNILINDSLAILFRVPLSDSSKATIKTTILLSGQTSDYYWTNAWNAYLANPTDMAAYQTIFSRLRDLYKYLMELAEYQLA